MRYIPAFGQIFSVDFSPDGKHFATAMQKGDLLIWDCVNCAVTERLAIPDRIRAIQWADDGTLRVRSQRAVTIWDVPAISEGVSAKPIRTPRSISVAHNGLIAEAIGLKDQKLQLRRATDDEPVALAHPKISVFSSLNLVADGKLLVAAPEYKQPAALTVYDTASGDRSRAIDLQPLGVASGAPVAGIPGTSRIVTTNGTEVFVIDAASGNVVVSWPIPMKPSREGQRLRVPTLVPTANGTRVCVAVSYRGLLVCDLQTGTKLAELTENAAWDVKWSDAGRFAVGVRNHIELRDANLELIRSLPADFERRVLSTCFSADGRRIYGVGEGRIIRGYDVVTGMKVLTEVILPDPIVLPMSKLRWHGTTLVGSSGGYDYHLRSAPDLQPD